MDQTFRWPLSTSIFIIFISLGKKERIWRLRNGWFSVNLPMRLNSRQITYLSLAINNHLTSLFTFSYPPVLICLHNQFVFLIKGILFHIPELSIQSRLLFRLQCHLFLFLCDLAASRNSPMLKSSFFACMVSREDWGLSASDEISCKYNGDLFLT